MAIEVPSPNKVYTTRYDNFRGIDVTNDATNVWRRRSPFSVNMTPNEAGKPFKRNGWDIVINEEKFYEVLGETVEDFGITMCYYFTLAGDPHIIVFTTAGVFKVVNSDVSLLGTDQIMIDAYERAFFFEGGGTSAFYIYAKQNNVWKYWYDGTYHFEIVQPHIPTIRYKASPNLEEGQDLESVNILSPLVYIEYNDNNYTISENPHNVLLPSNVAQSQLSEVRVFVSVNSQFDTELDVVSSSEIPSTGECSLHTNELDDGQAWIEFNKEYPPIVVGEDAIRVQYPSAMVESTDHDISANDIPTSLDFDGGGN